MTVWYQVPGAVPCNASRPSRIRPCDPERRRVTANMWPCLWTVNPLLTYIYIWKSFCAPRLSFSPPFQPLRSLSSSFLKLAWIAGLLFSDMNVIPDTLGLNCLRFQYRAEQERNKRGSGKATARHGRTCGVGLGCCHEYLRLLLVN